MIKIRIDNSNQELQEYKDTIINSVAFRVTVLQQSLSHLNRVIVNFNPIKFKSLKPITKGIIKIVGDGEKTFKSGTDYINQLSQYLSKTNNLSNINIKGLLLFCQNMLANNNQQLSDLLICDANNLLNMNRTILNLYGINSTTNINVIKLAFDYKRYNADIAIPIRSYFRKNEFVKFCPYCNKDKAIHQTNSADEIVESYQLDHFHDKSRHPLLSYSLFNLVPSDTTCNVTNKGSIEFSEKYHMNPHSSSYIDSIQFIPIGLNPAYDVDKIELKILEVQGSNLYKKINGTNQPTKEKGKLGNLNVFKIRSKYEDKTHEARQILKNLHKENKNFKHIQKYLIALKPINRQANYIKWYEKELNAKFHPSDFNSKALSKFCRDIHDYYFKQNMTVFNRYIIALINS